MVPILRPPPPGPVRGVCPSAAPPHQTKKAHRVFGGRSTPTSTFEDTDYIAPLEGSDGGGISIGTVVFSGERARSASVGKVQMLPRLRFGLVASIDGLGRPSSRMGSIRVGADDLAAGDRAQGSPDRRGDG